jgi:hypothetical protein
MKASACGLLGCPLPSTLFRALKVSQLTATTNSPPKSRPLWAKDFDSVVLENVSRPANITPYKNQSTIHRSQK